MSMPETYLLLNKLDELIKEIKGLRGGIQRMLAEIESQRPTGKHNNRHTATCGCENK